MSSVVLAAAVCAFGAQAQAQTTGQAQCPGVISWVHAPKVGTLLNEDTGLPDFNPKKHVNQVTYVGRFVLVSQIGVVAGLPHRPAVLISGLSAPRVRIASHVQEVEWRMINAGHAPLNLRITAHATSGSAHEVFNCQLAAPRHASGKAKQFAYLRLFWKPSAQGHYQYQVSIANQGNVTGTIERVNAGLRYGQ